MNKKGAPQGGEGELRPELWRLTKGEEDRREKRRGKKKRLAGGRNGRRGDGGLRTTSFPKSCFRFLRLVGSISPP